MKHLSLSFTVNLLCQIIFFKTEHTLASAANRFSNTMFKLHNFCHFLNQYTCTGTCILPKTILILVGFVI